MSDTPAELVVKITDQCTVRFPPLLPADQRDAIVAKMRGIPKHRAPRAVNHPRARAAAEKHGTAVLTATGRGETEYFKFRCCKNRNLHLEFRNLDLVKELNLLAIGERVLGEDVD